MNKQQDLAPALIQLLGTGSLGLMLVALAADVVAADARFNYWFANQAKRTLSDKDLDQTLDMYEELTIDCRGAIEAFKNSRDEQNLSSVLEEALARLAARPSG